MQSAGGELGLIAGEDVLAALAPRPPALWGRVLLIDPCAEARRLLTHHLRRAGAQVMSTGSTETGLEEAIHRHEHGRQFELILIDVGTGLSDRCEPVRRLRGLGYPGPVVALTAWSGPLGREQCIEAGCDGALEKPIDRASLVSMCQCWIGSGRGRMDDAA